MSGDTAPDVVGGGADNPLSLADAAGLARLVRADERLALLVEPVQNCIIVSRQMCQRRCNQGAPNLQLWPNLGPPYPTSAHQRTSSEPLIRQSWSY